MKASKLAHKILKFINYANLCKFTEPRKGPGGAIRLFFYLFFFYFFLLLLFLFFYIFLTLIFLFLVPSRGIKCPIFWPVENCTTWNLRYLMLRDAGWALRHWRSCYHLYLFCKNLSLVMYRNSGIFLFLKIFLSFVPIFLRFQKLSGLAGMWEGYVFIQFSSLPFSLFQILLELGAASSGWHRSSSHLSCLLLRQ